MINLYYEGWVTPTVNSASILVIKFHESLTITQVASTPIYPQQHPTLSYPTRPPLPPHYSTHLLDAGNRRRGDASVPRTPPHSVPSRRE